MEMPRINPEFKVDLNILQGNLTSIKGNSIAKIAGRGIRKLEAGVQKLDHFIKTSNWESKQTRSLNQLEKHVTVLKSALEDVNSKVSKHEKTDKLISDHNKLNKELIQELGKMDKICQLIANRSDKADKTKLSKVHSEINNMISTCEKDIVINKFTEKVLKFDNALKNFEKEMKGSVDQQTIARFSDYNKNTLKELEKLMKSCENFEKTVDGRHKQREINLIKDQINNVSTRCMININNSRPPEKPKAELEKLGDLSFSDMPELKAILNNKEFDIKNPKHVEFFKKTVMNRAMNGVNVISELTSIKPTGAAGRELLSINEFFDYAKAQVRFGGSLKGCVGLEGTLLKEKGGDQFKVDLLKDALKYRDLSAEDVRYFIDAMNIRNSPVLKEMLEDQGYIFIAVPYKPEANFNLKQNQHLPPLKTAKYDPSIVAYEYLRPEDSGKAINPNKKSVFG